MGESEVSESIIYTHLGVPCDKYHQLDENVQMCCTKLRRTYFGKNDYGISHKALHPLTMTTYIQNTKPAYSGDLVTYTEIT